MDEDAGWHGPSGEDEYLAQRLSDALAADPRVSELGLSVRLAADGAHVSGEVATPERRAAIADVAAEVAPGRPIHNEVTVTSWDEAEDMEVLP